MTCNISHGKVWGSHTLLCLLDTFSLAYGFRGALVVTGNVTVDMDFMRTGVEVSFETEASLDFITTVQFSEYPFLVCMQMDKTTFPVRYCETLPVKERFQCSLVFYWWISFYKTQLSLFLMFCFQWIPDQVWELVIREERRVTQEQEAAPPWLWIPSSSGELKHVQEGFWLQLVEEMLWTIQERVVTQRGFIAFRDRYHTSASCSERPQKRKVVNGFFFVFFLKNTYNVYIPVSI